MHDRDTIQNQHQHQLASHKFSVQAKTKKRSPDATINAGDLVYLVADRNKSHVRNRYIVTSREGLWCSIRKFTGNIYKIRHVEFA